MYKKIYSFLILCIAVSFIFISCKAENANVNNVTGRTSNTAGNKTQKPGNTDDNSVMKPGEYKAATNIPSLFINLDNNKRKRHITKEEYLDAKFSLVGAEGYSDIIEKQFYVKGRGNFSWSFDKKPLTLRFDEKIDLLGMGAGKTWVLVNNYVDKTLMRNYLTFQFAADMGLKYTPECKFVDVYINGEYEGNYLFFEKIGISSERVDIDDKKGAVLFEIEMQFRHGDCTYCYETPSGVHIMYSDYNENADIKDIMNEKNAFLEDLDNSLRKGYSEYTKYIDVESFINWYIVNEFAKNYDSKFVTSCYCYIGNDNKLYMGPVWDYDTCYGNQNTDNCMYPEGYHVNLAPWYNILLEDADFSRLLKERWTKAVDDKIIDGLTNYLDEAGELTKASRELNFERWPEALYYELRRENLQYTYEGELEHFKTFIKERKAWLDTQWNLNQVSEDGVIINTGNSFVKKVDISSVKAPAGANQLENAEYLFDGNLNTKFCTQEYLPLSVEWKMKEEIKVIGYYLTTANDEPGRTPKKWKFFGSDDGENWTVISEVNDGKMPSSFFTYKEYKADRSGTYMYFKFEIYETNGIANAVQLSEFSII